MFGAKRGVFVIVERAAGRDAPRMLRRPASRTSRIAALAFPDAQSLDVVGPLEVFSRTSRWLMDNGKRKDPAYVVEILGVTGGPVRTSSGMRLIAERPFSAVERGIDTLLVAGGIGIGNAAHPSVFAWLVRQARKVRRLASVCTGAFLLAEAGLLDGLRATTHWGSCAELARRFPDVKVERDVVFVRDGATYTSGGVTAGMDLALALVEEDHGRAVAHAVARELVMFLRRPGGQAQISAQLAAQFAAAAPLADLQTYIVEHPTDDLSAGALARRVSMSPRNFARVFTKEIGVPPARFVTQVRVETARRLLEESDADLASVCASSGLGTPESMRRAFLRVVGMPPGEYRQRHEAGPRKRRIA
jgi:transcriptional regulator GlxA family with amidase domain